MKAGPLGSTEGVYATAHREALLPQLYRSAGKESIADTRECDCFAHEYGNAAENPSGGHCYPTGMRDSEWAAVRGMVPKPVWAEGRGGRPEEYCHRDILDAVRYVVDNGVKWSALPADYPPWKAAEQAELERLRKKVARLLTDLGVTRSHSRPRVSNDNPFSESQFRTTKYAPDHPARFDSLAHAREWMDAFISYYNHEHRHSGIGLHTPASVHFGTAQEVRDQRSVALAGAYERHPEHFARRPKPPEIPGQVWINDPTQRAQTESQSV